MRERIEKSFEKYFKSDEGKLFAAPGRVNLIGEHTDYNGGFVMPGAIDKCIMAKLAPNGSDKVNIYSINNDEYVTFSIKSSEKPISKSNWALYVYGVCCEMVKRGAKIGGFNAVYEGNVPFGAGLSSSAALESLFAYALNEIYSCNIDKKELARVGQDTENNYCGMKCGIMDQFASLFGKEGCLIKLDCSTMEYEYLPFNPVGYKVVLIDSKVKHELIGSPYNERRESCERVVAEIAKKHPGVTLLAEANFEMLEEVKGTISATDYKRATYVIGENARLEETCRSLKAGDYENVGRLLYATHKGLSEDYEVSTPEIDYLNAIAKRCGVTGSRIMGGGFGGCTINIVKEELYENFIKEVMSEYEAKFSVAPVIYEVKISDGARQLD